MRAFLLWFFAVLFFHTSSAYVVHGIVTDTKGERLGYTNIYINGTTNTTSANGQGEYQLELQPGKYEIVFQRIGYKQKLQPVVIDKADVQLNVSLEVNQYEINDVVINASEDPAYEIIRKAMEKRRHFLEAVESYSCDAYIKGMQRITDVPFWAKGRLEKNGISLDKNGMAILYLSESQSKLYYKKPNKFHEVVYSSKVSGRSQNFTFNSAQDFYFNFYEKVITIPFIAARPFISPLNENAFAYYRYKMLGATMEGDRMVYKIQVMPRHKSDPCFNGVLSIVRDNWNIHSLELYLVKDNGLEYVDTLRVTQYFLPIKDDIWLPAQQRYDARAGFLGVKGDGYYIGIFKNYNLNSLFGAGLPKIDSTARPKKAERLKKKAEQKAEKKLFTPEIIKIEEGANKRDTTYWDSIRPIPLTGLEVEDYTLKDSIQTIRDSKEYKDSTDKEINQPGVLSVLLGYTAVKQNKRIQIDMPSLPSLINFNTVEGINLQLKMRIQKTFKRTGGPRLWFEPVFRYGITNKQFNAMGTLGLRTSQKNSEYIVISGGKFISQFNDEQPQPYFGNTLKSLVFRHNDFKIYEQYFGSVTYSRELYNGIYGTIGVKYAQRHPLENTNLYSFFPKVRPRYTPNGVDLPNTDYSNDNITAHNALLLNLEFRFVFGQQFITRPDYKIRTDSKFPELTLTYKRGIPIKGVSDVDFDFIEMQVRGYIPLRLAGRLQYKFGGGGFPSTRYIQYSDYKHFYGRFLNTGQTDLLGFFNIGFYRHSTNEYFAEAHLENHFGGLLFNIIPGIRKLKLQEVLGFHVLYTPVRKQYFQLDAGIENILKVLRVDFITGFGSQKGEHYFGCRLGLTLDFSR